MTIHNFEIELSDVDRGVYQTLAIRAARHPSEAEDYLVTRVLAYCLEYAEGIAFSNGLAEPDEPPLAVRDLTGVMRVCIDIGVPDAAQDAQGRQGRGRVVVYTHKDPEKVARSWAGEHIHRGAELELYSVARPFLTELVARLKRRMVFAPR
jgi:uncharacterized protein YaeQ